MDSYNATTFSDAKGRRWEPRLDFVKIREIRSETKIDGLVDASIEKALKQ